MPFFVRNNMSRISTGKEQTVTQENKKMQTASGFNEELPFEVPG